MRVSAQPLSHNTSPSFALRLSRAQDPQMSESARTPYSKSPRLAICMAATLLLSACGGTDRSADVPEPAPRAAVVSGDPLATEAGRHVLQDLGGTAADAAVAVAAALSVVEPYFSSALGGGTWALYYDNRTGAVSSLDGVGPTGSLATVADYEDRANASGMHQANVPGAWDGWMVWLENFGTLELGEVLAPAIALGRDGFIVGPRLAQIINNRGVEIRSRPETTAIYVNEQDQLATLGDRLYQRDMADTFQSLVDAYDAARPQGRAAAFQAARDHFYRGPIAEAIVAFSEANNGYLTLEDFNGFETGLVAPISIDYRDYRVYQNPPNSQGITMLMALNTFDRQLRGCGRTRDDLSDADWLHLQVESVKLAFADRHYHVGDHPDARPVPIDALLDPERPDRACGAIDLDVAREWPIEDTLWNSKTMADHTTTFHITDAEGNAAAVTTSLGFQFLVVGETGIHINNRMRMLALDDGNPNQLSPGAKVRHTSNPFMALKDGLPAILGGNTGADTQSQGQFQLFLHVVEDGRGPQQAVNQPRFVSRGFPATSFPYAFQNDLQLELRAGGIFSPTVRQSLEARGHDLTPAGAVGSANMLVLDADSGRVCAGAEPRDASAAWIGPVVSGCD
jgi:gamma-glutamyltranspeptidase/glutathione hydrolase